jgi:hypothetical protein
MNVMIRDGELRWRILFTQLLEADGPGCGRFYTSHKLARDKFDSCATHKWRTLVSLDNATARDCVKMILSGFCSHVMSWKTDLHNILEPVLGRPSKKESKTTLISRIW